jgi:hypothetical protein
VCSCIENESYRHYYSLENIIFLLESVFTKTKTTICSSSFVIVFVLYISSVNLLTVLCCFVTFIVKMLFIKMSLHTSFQLKLFNCKIGIFKSVCSQICFVSSKIVELFCTCIFVSIKLVIVKYKNVVVDDNLMSVSCIVFFLLLNRSNKILSIYGVNEWLFVYYIFSNKVYVLFCLY